jgi:hypothetical protein
MAEKGLRSWVKENWVDIANKKPDGSYPKCGRSGGEKRKKYPKCVPIAKARAMSKGQRAGAVKRKQAKSNTGPTPSRAATFAKRKKRSAGTPASGENSMVRQAQRNYIGSYVSGDLGGVQVSNPSSRKYYSNPGFKMPKI